ncbi:uncharacterized protein CEXT_239151 [Caerostris extrusa]|uniref:Transmembrane protein 231 n=1 Tax=Caerostris extrusa TaxID=172846 RepID=A0AAV4PP32_CAEEX|nr:uncharacterized protein CEXT_239151 [Caerostris extrusa]
MTKQGSVVRTTWSHNSLVSPRCTPAPTFKRSKEEVRVPFAFLIESFQGELWNAFIRTVKKRNKRYSGSSVYAASATDNRYSLLNSRKPYQKTTTSLVGEVSGLLKPFIHFRYHLHGDISNQHLYRSFNQPSWRVFENYKLLVRHDVLLQLLYLVMVLQTVWPYLFKTMKVRFWTTTECGWRRPFYPYKDTILSPFGFLDTPRITQGQRKKAVDSTFIRFGRSSSGESGRTMVSHPGASLLLEDSSPEASPQDSSLN